jgi:non-specific protein-tyrosine kinase
MPRPSEFRRYLALASRWWWLAVVAALVAAAGAFALTPRRPPLYMASATLMFQSSLYRTAGSGDEKVAQYLTQVGQGIVRSGGAEPGSSGASSGMSGGAMVRWLPNTLLIELIATDIDPARAAARANAAADLFIAWNRKQNQERYGKNAAALQDQMDQLSAEMAALQAQIATLSAPATSQEVAEKAQLVLTLATARMTYASRLALYGRTLADAVLSEANLTVIAKATAPREAMGSSTRRIARNMILGGMVGVALAIGAAFLWEYLDDTVKTADDIKRMWGLSTLGAIGRLTGENRELIAATQPRSSISEQFRMLRTNIRYFGVERPLRTLLVTSAIPGEGKSTTAANLAVAMAQAGQKVALLDGDLRRPRLHRLFNVPLQGGLATSLLTGHLDGNFQPTPAAEGLSVLPAGPLPPNPAELLGSQRMRELLDDLAQQVDVVLIDSPPVLPVADTMGLAHMVDGVLLVVDSGKTRRGMVRQAIERLRQVGGNLIGVVLNRIPPPGRDGQHHYTDRTS